MVGLSAAWYLQELGVEIVVLDREGVAAGSSRGNAGWLTPSLVAPLPEPSVLRFGLRAVLSPSSPVYVPPSADPRLLQFLAHFARNCTHRRWRQAMSALVLLNEGALDAFAELDDAGLGVRTRAAEPILAAYRHEAARDGLVQELRHIAAAGQPVDYDLLTGDEARSLEPALSEVVASAIRLNSQRFIDPGAFVDALGDAVRARGGQIRSGSVVRAVEDEPTGVRVDGERFDAVVIATGARLGELARRVGVRRLVQAGRGYSFSVSMDDVPKGPLYLPAERVACTPVGDRLRVAGMMEFRPVDAPLDDRRITAIANATGPFLRGADFGDRQDEWVGSRPCTDDGLPLIGRSRNPRVFVAGGHGMWGITLGPVTGKLLAQQIVSGQTPDALRAVDPLR